MKENFRIETNDDTKGKDVACRNYCRNESDPAQDLWQIIIIIFIKK